MIELSEKDFLPIAESPLVWRWSPHGNTPLSQTVLAELRCICPDKASEIHDIILMFYQRDGSLDNSIFNLVRPFSAVKHEEARGVLLSLPIQKTQRVVLSWQKDTAIVCPWLTFVWQWQSFCYPSSDDVSIFPAAQEWLLTYYHYDLFEYAELNAV